MEQNVPGMKLAWQSQPDGHFVIGVLTAGSQVILEFWLTPEEVKGLSAEIDRGLLAGNGSLLHLPRGHG